MIVTQKKDSSWYAPALNLCLGGVVVASGIRDVYRSNVVQVALRQLRRQDGRHEGLTRHALAIRSGEMRRDPAEVDAIPVDGAPMLPAEGGNPLGGAPGQLAPDLESVTADSEFLVVLGSQAHTEAGTPGTTRGQANPVVRRTFPAAAAAARPPSPPQKGAAAAAAAVRPPSPTLKKGGAEAAASPPEKTDANGEKKTAPFFETSDSVEVSVPEKTPAANQAIGAAAPVAPRPNRFVLVGRWLVGAGPGGGADPISDGTETMTVDFIPRVNVGVAIIGIAKIVLGSLGLWSGATTITKKLR